MSITQSESEAELTAMLLLAAKSIDLEVPKAPSLERSWLDDCFLGVGSNVPPRSTPGPFFPKVHEELTKTWRAPYTARSRLSSSLLTSLDGGAARGYVDVPQVERVVAVHLCPQNAATWRNRPRLPSKACKLSSPLAAKAYSAAGQGASALHAMAILQVTEGAPLRLLHLLRLLRHQKGQPLNPRVELAAGEWRSPWIRALLRTPASPRSGPDANDTAAGGLVSAPQPIPSVDPDSPTRLHDSICEAPAQVQGRPLHLCPYGHGCLCPACGDCGSPGEGCNQAVPPAEMKLPFKMLTAKRILSCIRHQDWFAAIDLKDAYFHVSILPRHRPFLRVAFEGRAYQYKVLPFGLALSPRIFTKLAEGTLFPLWERGIGILNYLDDWLIIAHSRDLLCEHRDLVLLHLSRLGLQVNWEKSKLSPVQSIFLVSSWYGVGFGRHVGTLHEQRLLGHMAAAATVTPLGLLHMRPLQHWLYGQVPRWAWHHGTFWVGVTPECRRRFSPWSDPAFLRAGVPLGQVSRHVVVNTDASETGWGAVCNRQAASGSWSGPRMHWHINCLELLAVLLALRFPVLCETVAQENRSTDTVVETSWDLSMVLSGLRRVPFEPLASVELKICL
ncbi:Gag-Pol polyprotein [Labeo rohita]|uniref:ribonuclease H n=1 Tax=Labeo rohita TaxID=84645 RepID=A0ABQ8MDK2_LABRO|nr:Gag-Pol polyprotein [Labeo rohita]